jgi:hypothetical protein
MARPNAFLGDTFERRRVIWYRKRGQVSGDLEPVPVR